MSIVDTYLEQLEELFRDFDSDSSNTKFDSTKANNAIEDGEEILNQLRVEVAGITNKTKKDEAVSKMNHYKDLIAKLKRELLTGGHDNGNNSNSMEQQMNSEERANDGLDKLKSARRELAETENVAVDTHQRVVEQTGQLKKIKDNTQQVNSELNYGNKLLNRMSKWWRG